MTEQVRSPRRRGWRIGRPALACSIVLGVVLAFAAAARAAVEAAIPLPGCCPAQTVELGGSVFVMTDAVGGPEQPTIVRIDPSTNTITGQLTLSSGTPTGNTPNGNAMAVSAGALWVVQYFRDDVLRIDPVSLTVSATISTGRSPASIASDGRGLWVSLSNDAAVTRIDPATNRRTATVFVGSRKGADQPGQLAVEGTDVLVDMPASARVARIDIRTHAVRYDRVGVDAAACARILPVPGGYWLDDTDCGAAYYRWTDHAHALTASIDPSPTHDYGAVVVGSVLYAGEYECGPDTCFDGKLGKYDATTGAPLGLEHIGDDASLPNFAAGSLWVGDWANGAIQRVTPF